MTNLYTCELCGAQHTNEFSLTCRLCDFERESGDAAIPDDLLAQDFATFLSFFEED